MASVNHIPSKTIHGLACNLWLLQSKCHALKAIHGQATVMYIIQGICLVEQIYSLHIGYTYTTLAWTSELSPSYAPFLNPKNILSVPHTRKWSPTFIKRCTLTLTWSLQPLLHSPLTQSRLSQEHPHPAHARKVRKQQANFVMVRTAKTWANTTKAHACVKTADGVLEARGHKCTNIGKHYML
jgi:hypothetical protein